MGLLRKKEPDIDYTLLQKKGIMKKRKERTLPYRVNSSGLIDLTPQNLGNAESSSESVDSLNLNSQSDNSSGNAFASGNPFGFLDGIASASSSGTSGMAGGSSGSLDIAADVSSLKIKIDDLEFKLGQFIDKLELVESKLLNFENRIT